ncbi:hypothetical protein NMY22_g5045 [Coprinellus aureogranulatus]|nr:hypothetical protein NMY22_g5045 [Coprinellus aureogranulatus]
MRISRRPSFNNVLYYANKSISRLVAIPPSPSRSALAIADPFSRRVLRGLPSINAPAFASEDPFSCSEDWDPQGYRDALCEGGPTTRKYGYVHTLDSRFAFSSLLCTTPFTVLSGFYPRFTVGARFGGPVFQRCFGVLQAAHPGKARGG